ncbi:MAG: ArsC/Spx/MgsR family protein [Deltaproteobacteria bacterium]
MKVHGLSHCGTTKQALADLREAGYAPDLRDVRVEKLTRDELTALFAVLGDKLLNRASQTWRGLSEAEQKVDPIDLILAHDALMKRPVVQDGDKLTMGWTANVKRAWNVPV